MITKKHKAIALIQLSGIKFRQKVSIGNHRLLALSPAVSPLEVEFRDLVELYDISAICLIQDLHKKNDHQEA